MSVSIVVKSSNNYETRIITFKREQLKTNGYVLRIQSRPPTKEAIRKLQDNRMQTDKQLLVVKDSLKNCYVIIDGQNLFESKAEKKEWECKEYIGDFRNDEKFKDFLLMESYRSSASNNELTHAHLCGLFLDEYISMKTSQRECYKKCSHKFNISERMARQVLALGLALSEKGLIKQAIEEGWKWKKCTDAIEGKISSADYVVSELDKEDTEIKGTKVKSFLGIKEDEDLTIDEKKSTKVITNGDGSKVKVNWNDDNQKFGMFLKTFLSKDFNTIKRGITTINNYCDTKLMSVRDMIDDFTSIGDKDDINKECVSLAVAVDDRIDNISEICETEIKRLKEETQKELTVKVKEIREIENKVKKWKGELNV